jgi:hypothetical protein
MSRSVDYRETLVTYLRGNSLDEVAQTLGINKAALYGRITWMRKHGVKVPRFANYGGGISKLEVSQLNSIIAKHNREVSGGTE